MSNLLSLAASSATWFAASACMTGAATTVRTNTWVCKHYESCQVYTSKPILPAVQATGRQLLVQAQQQHSCTKRVTSAMKQEAQLSLPTHACRSSALKEVSRQADANQPRDSSSLAPDCGDLAHRTYFSLMFSYWLRAGPRMLKATQPTAGTKRTAKSPSLLSDPAAICPSSCAACALPLARNVLAAVLISASLPRFCSTIKY